MCQIIINYAPIIMKQNYWQPVVFSQMYSKYSYYFLIILYLIPHRVQIQSHNFRATSFFYTLSDEQALK